VLRLKDAEETRKKWNVPDGGKKKHVRPRTDLGKSVTNYHGTISPSLLLSPIKGERVIKGSDSILALGIAPLPENQEIPANVRIELVFPE
jgi:hypothetical protein